MFSQRHPVLGAGSGETVLRKTYEKWGPTGPHFPFSSDAFGQLTICTALASLTLSFNSQVTVTFSPTFSVFSLKPEGSI